MHDALMRVKPDDLTPNAWAVKAGVNRAVWVEMRKRDNPTRKTLEKLLGAIGMTFAEFEATLAPVRSEVRPVAMSGAEIAAVRSLPRAPLVPLFGTAFGGDWEEDIELTELNQSEVLRNFDRPAWLADDSEAYAIEIVGESMVPRFKPGEIAFVSPRLPVRAGDDVVVQLTDPDAAGDLERRVTMVLIKELVRQSGSYYELRQYNPDRTFRVDRSRVRRIHRVKGRP